MVAEHKKLNLEVPEEELVEELTADEDAQQLNPLDTNDTAVSEADWAQQLQSEPFDDDEREE